jgi:hypothetical protein
LTNFSSPLAIVVKEVSCGKKDGSITPKHTEQSSYQGTAVASTSNSDGALCHGAMRPCLAILATDIEVKSVRKADAGPGNYFTIVHPTYGGNELGVETPYVDEKKQEQRHNN